MSFDKLISKIQELENPTVVGLDSDLSYIPKFIIDEGISKFGESFEAAEYAIFEFNKAIIDEIYDIVPSIKPQCAFYEKYSWQGVRALKNTIDYAKSRGMYIIKDGKRNDIGSTVEAFAHAYLGETTVGNSALKAFDGDALTVNAYLGYDGIKPLVDACKTHDKGIFVLCKTSNPSSGDLQDLEFNGKPIYEHMGGLLDKWGTDNISPKTHYNAVGAVVGATWPEQLTTLRKNLPHTFFLMPGYGAQGGTAENLRGAFDKDGNGAIINSSRGIIAAYKIQNLPEKDFAKAARAEALKMRDDLRKVWR